MRTEKGKNKRILEGSLRKAILTLGWPIALSSVIQTFYNLVDAYWIGKLGKAQLSAPFISFQLVFLFISFSIGFAIAGTSLVAQYTGSKDEMKSNIVASHVLMLLTVLILLFSIIGFFSAETLLKLLETPKDAFGYTMDYFKIMFAGLTFAVPFFVYQGILNGYGDPVSPLKVQAVSVGINLLLDPMLIFGWLFFPELGVQGAAIATISTRSLASFLGLYHLFKGQKGIKLSLKCFIPHYKIFLKIIKVGLPASLGISGSSLGFVLVQGIINSLGSAVIAAAGIGYRMVHLFMLPAIGISSAVTTIVGQNLGADNIKRAKESIKLGMRIILMFLVPAMIITSFSGEFIMKFFIPGDEIVQLIGIKMFYILPSSVIFFAIFRVYSSAFQGSGRTVPIMTTSLIRIWMARLPVIWLLVIKFSMGHYGVWFGMLFSNVVVAVLMFILYNRGKWQKPVIKDKKKN